MSNQTDDRVPHENIGQQYIDAHKKQDNRVVQVSELRKEFTKDYMKNLEKAALDGKKKLSQQSDDAKPFYVVVLLRKERLMKKVIRSAFTARKTCPTPNYDQTVYQYDPKTDELSFLWVIPSEEITNFLYKNRYQYDIASNSLLPYVVDFVQGRLYNKMLDLNGERRIIK